MDLFFGIGNIIMGLLFASIGFRIYIPFKGKSTASIEKSWYGKFGTFFKVVGILVLINGVFMTFKNLKETTIPSSVLETKETSTDYFFVDLTGAILDENRDTVTDCLIYVLSDNDYVYNVIDNSTNFVVQLPLGHKYRVGFKKEGYIQKHLIVDLIKHGEYEDYKYGFEFPMELKLIVGDINEPSLNVAQLGYNDSAGYIDVIERTVLN
jgi:hypothetical protein